MTDARAILCDYMLSSYAINRHLAGLPARRPPPGAPRRTNKSTALHARRLLRLLGERARVSRKTFTLFRGTTAATPWLVADRFFDPTSKQLRRGASALFTSAFLVREVVSVTSSRRVAAGFASYFGQAGRRRRGWVHVIRCDRRVRSLSISPAACGAAWDVFAGEREVLLCPPLSATRTRVDRSRRTIYWRIAPADT